MSYRRMASAPAPNLQIYWVVKVFIMVKRVCSPYNKNTLFLKMLKNCLYLNMHKKFVPQEKYYKKTKSKEVLSLFFLHLKLLYIFHNIYILLLDIFSIAIDRTKPELSGCYYRISGTTWLNTRKDLVRIPSGYPVKPDLACTKREYWMGLEYNQVIRLPENPVKPNKIGPGPDYLDISDIRYNPY